MSSLTNSYKGLDAKEKAMQVVDVAAEGKRKSSATIIYGQDSLYLQKIIDSDRFLKEGTISPLIEADMHAYDITAKQAVNNMKSARDSWFAIMKNIEVIRLKAKKQIRETAGNPFDIAKQAKKDIEALANAK